MSSQVKDQNQGSAMDIFSIPIEVVDANVLPYLEWNDLLRLRRVCKWTKEITDSYLRVHPELAPEIEINEDEMTFDAFLKMGIPTNRIFLNNQSGDEFFQNGGAGASEFLEKQGHLVKFLRVDQLSLMIYGKEWDFLVALKKIESFEAGRLGGYHRTDRGRSTIDQILKEKEVLFRQDPRAWNVDTDEMIYPVEFFEYLKTLKIGYDEYGYLPEPHLFKRCDSYLKICSQLEFVSLPYSPFSRVEQDYFPDLHGRPLALAFGVMIAYIRKRSDQGPSVGNYKVIDFGNYHIASLNLEASPHFLELCAVALHNEVKLTGVTSCWFEERGRRLEFYSPDLGIPVVSLIDLDPSMIDMNMPNLEKVEIRSTLESSPGANWRRDRAEWPSLKTLDITADFQVVKPLEMCFVDIEEDQVRTTSVGDLVNVFNFFFEDISRTSLTELRLRFKNKKNGHLLAPNTEHIVAACPNLKKLTLINWPGTNEALTKLWSGLPALEEVSLESCEGLGNEAFVGNDGRGPVFLRLKNLKKLTLKELELMPKVTDKLFIRVLAHMKLTHLYLTTVYFPTNKVTLAGVRALSKGRFAESIEKFPFKNWSLRNVSEEELRKMERTFRSFRML